MPITVRRNHAAAWLPQSNGQYSPCFMLFADANVLIDPCSGRFINTGISLALEPWTIGILYPSQRVLSQGLSVPAQIIDCGKLRPHPLPFVEISIWINNPKAIPVMVDAYQAIAQLVVLHCARPTVEEEVV